MFPNITPEAVRNNRKLRWISEATAMRNRPPEREGHALQTVTAYIEAHMQDQHGGHVEGCGQEQGWGWRT